MASAELFRTLQNIERVLTEKTEGNVQLVGLASDGELFLRPRSQVAAEQFVEQVRSLRDLFPVIEKFTYVYEPGVEELKEMVDGLNAALRQPKPQLLDILE